MRRYFVLLGVVALPGCLNPFAYACEADTQCQFNGERGTCVTPPGHCAYPDDGCASALRYGPSADDLANACVELQASADGSGTTGATGTTACAGGCPAKPCHAPGECVDGSCRYPRLPEGAACEDDDPCSTASVCDSEGQCVANEFKPCDPAEGSCFAAGTCDAATGECVFTSKEAGAPCEDGNDCSLGDACNESGECIPGEVCPSANPCEIGSCSGGTCEFSPVGDGEKCGTEPGERCCGGQCVDISQDEQHCGQCFFACAGSNECVSVVEPAQCGVDVAESGRCRCNASNAQCDGGDEAPGNDQVCRTVAPINYCTPEAGACPEQLEVLNSCPDYCRYDG